jgi:hypothetical protein
VCLLRIRDTAHVPHACNGGSHRAPHSLAPSLSLPGSGPGWHARGTRTTLMLCCMPRPHRSLLHALIHAHQQPAQTATAPRIPSSGPAVQHVAHKQPGTALPRTTSSLRMGRGAAHAMLHSALAPSRSHPVLGSNRPASSPLYGKCNIFTSSVNCSACSTLLQGPHTPRAPILLHSIHSRAHPPLRPSALLPQQERLEDS